MKLAQIAVPAGVLLAGAMLLSNPTYAKPEYAKKEKQKCVYCHTDVKKNPKDFTDAGKYYSEHSHSLEGYTEKK
jgi:hypothetical protein